jgi:putative ABC transport system permease protein
LLTGLVFGLAPVFGSLGFSVREALQQEGRSASGSVALRRTRQVLVVAQLGLSLTLLIAAGLLAKSFWGLRNTDPGFRPENLLTARIALTGPAYRTLQRQDEFFQHVTEEVARLPGVESVALSNSIPPGLGRNALTFTIEGKPAPPRDQEPRSNFIVPSDNYFSTFSVPLLAGRGLNSSDRADSPRVLVVNDTFRRLNFPGEEAVGQRIKFGNVTYTIVGVVADTRHYGFEQEVAPMIFASMHQQDNPQMLNRRWITIRTKGDQPGLAGALTRIVSSIDHDQPVADIRTIEERISNSLGSRRFNAALIGSFALAAVFLGAIGVYGVMSYLVGLRLHEMGIRLALGAQPPQILGMVLKEGVVLGLLGAIIGVAGALGLSQYLGSLLFGVSAHDTAVFATLTAALFAVVIAATFIPGRQASKTDPLTALRHD